LIAGLIVLALTGAARAEEIDYGSYHALVIGNNAYQNLPELETAINDAEAVAELLERKYDFTVRLMRNATRADLLRALNDFRAELTEADNLLIYYAGHGYLDRTTQTGFWQPIDAEMYDDLNWIANEDLTRRINAMTANHVLVIADSCYSGTLVRAAETELPTGGERDAWLRRMVEKRSRTAMVSGGLEPVSDAGTEDHSVFAYAFLTALEENAVALDGQSLFRIISRPVIVNAEQTPQYSDIRRAGHEGGEFIFVPIIIQPVVAAPAAAPPPDQAAEMAFWQAIAESERASDYEAYLTQYPEGTFAPLAQSRVAALQAAVAPAASIAGDWVTDVLTNPYARSNTYRYHFSFRVIGDRIMGTALEKSTPDDPRPYAVERAVMDGRFDGELITFYIPYEVFTGDEWETEAHRKEVIGVLDGDSLSFILQDDGGGPPMEFNAVRGAAAEE
jgi:uncharacterized caspase-like protein